MNQAARFLLDLLFPPRCAFCRTLLDTSLPGICKDCRQDLPWLTGADAEIHGTVFSLCATPLRYQDKVRDSIRRYKFEGRFGYAAAYGPLLAQCVTEHLAGQYDLISWAPLSARRKRERGYDQAFLLAREAARHLETVPVPTLCKVRHTAAQSGLTETRDRQTNVADAYTILDPGQIRGKRVLLIDDVVTSGSTLSACARVLLDAGAASVVCAVLARAR